MSVERALYQKYRPTSFGEIIEQRQVVGVLEAATKEGNAAHAYLFTGPRGIGKTSVARVFARSLGCKDIDVFEIDAASHTSVEHIREISSSVYTQPIESDRKVYIFDEVHMLSKAAFNAFLKTLEEPPSYVVFILVTTEAEKLPETIVSRCVQLHFQQPSVAVLQNVALSVAKKEGYTLSEESCALISLMAEGSFRDMLTLLQKVFFVAGDSNVISHETVEEVLGAPRHQLVNAYLTALADGAVSDGVSALGRAAELNANMPLFAKLCVQKLRAALLLREGVSGPADSHTEEDSVFITDLSKKERVTLALLRSCITLPHTIAQSYVKTLPLECLLLEFEE